MSDEPTYIKRFPFARMTLVRRLVDAGEGCDWCGNFRRRNIAGGKEKVMVKLYQYGMEHDSLGEIDWDNRKFCCVTCYGSYHDIDLRAN